MKPNNCLHNFLHHLSVMSLGRGTGYAGGGVDPVTQAVMAVGVKK